MSTIKSNSSQTSQILAIDYGKSKVGLAMANTENRIAFAYGVLKNDKNFPENLAKIIQKEKVENIVIGISKHTEFSEIEQAEKKIGEALKEKIPEIGIEYQNEMFTTKMAQANLIERGAKKIKNFDDQESARIILQSWLDRN